MSPTPTYSRSGAIRDDHNVVGEFFLEGTLQGEWHVLGSTSSSATYGWTGHLLPPPPPPPPEGEEGESTGNGDDPPPIEVTNTYDDFDHRVDRSASGVEYTSGVYSRTQVSGIVTDSGKRWDRSIDVCESILRFPGEGSMGGPQFHAGKIAWDTIGCRLAR